MNNLSSYCGLVDAKIRASDKDLPVLGEIWQSLKKLESERTRRKKEPQIPSPRPITAWFVIT